VTCIGRRDDTSHYGGPGLCERDHPSASVCKETCTATPRFIECLPTLGPYTVPLNGWYTPVLTARLGRSTAKEIGA